jgi:hypothetical protein
MSERPRYLRGYRQIVANGGFTAQNFIEEHFGLPLDSAVDLRVVWPGSGGTRIAQDVLGRGGEPARRGG